MKKLMRKLVLSSFALGLAVITLSTTTFAWYTSNKVVTATDINAGTAQSGTPLLMIAQKFGDLATDGQPKDAKHTTWAATVEVDEDELEGKTSQDMVPLQLISGKLQNLEGTEQKYGWLQFTLYFKNASSESTPLYVTQMDFVNDTQTSGLPSKDVLDAGREAMNSNPAATYRVNALRSILVETTTIEYTGTNSSVSPTKTTTKVFDPEGLLPTSLGDDYVSGWNAIDYYNRVMGFGKTDFTKITLPTDYYKDVVTLSSTGNTALSLATVPAAGTPEGEYQYVSVQFRIFLDGWDAACFDACQGQKISLKLAFSTEAGSVKYQVATGA